MIGFSEVNRDREEKVAQLKRDLKKEKLKATEFEIKLGTLQINYDKMEEQLAHNQADREDLTYKLHDMNKARHNAEEGKKDEHERNQSLIEAINLKDD